MKYLELYDGYDYKRVKTYQDKGLSLYVGKKDIHYRFKNKDNIEEYGVNIT